MGYQIDAILNAFAHYGFSGRCHLTGDYSEEHAAILFDQRQLTRSQHDTFWYADTPATPGANNWGNAIPRTCSWARFHHREYAQSFYLFNSHWDHERADIRDNSARLLEQMALSHNVEHDPMIIMGDFNTDEHAAAFQYLLQSPALKVRDSINDIPAAQRKHSGTFHGFSGIGDGRKIDAILLSNHFTTDDAAIITTPIDGRYPSDHFPVSVDCSLP